MAKMSAEMSANFDNLFEKVAKKECSLYSVLDKVAAELVKDKLFGTLYAEIIGKNKSDKQRATFKEQLILNLPHVTYNGKHGKTVAVDWVEMKENSNLNLAIKSYRFTAETDIVKPEVCVGHIEEEVEVPVMEIHTYESGYVKEIPALDKEGKPRKETKKMNLVPREKGVWGFTKEVKEAIKTTLNQF